MANPASTKKQIVESIKQANSILIAVSKNPSVDELSAALGFTIFLNKLDKHATAVFSGQVPPAITFLEPDKTFEATADSLRDFIIALDKEKADHLRYKVVDDSVKIFITPYRTTISESDLEFSQGDYNVELVIALNVENNDYLDAALSAHGKILHNADVATITAGHIKSELGSIEWHDDEASGVSEMLVNLIGDLKTAKAGLDEQIATALLTGLVSATDRFGNEATSSKGMTVAATLMAAGANPQLIAAKLEEASQPENSDEYPQDPQNFDGSTSLTEGAPTKLTRIRMVSDDSSEESPQDQEPEPEPEPEEDEDGVMRIVHTRPGDLDEVARQVMEDKQRKAAKAAKNQLDRLTKSPKKDKQERRREEQKKAEKPKRYQEAQEAEEQLAAVPAPPDITEDLRQATAEISGESTDSGYQSDHAIGPSVGIPSASDHVPSVGGTLNATAAQAAEEKRRSMQLDQNRMILKHGKPIGSRVPSLSGGAFNASMSQSDEPPAVDIFSGDQTPGFSMEYEEAPAPQSSHQPQQQPQPQQPQFDPAAAQAAANIVADVPELPPMQPNYAPQPAQPQYEQPQQQPPQQQFEQPQQAFGGGPTLAELEAQSLAASSPQPPVPPMPDFNSLPPLPSMPPGVDPSSLPGLPSVPPNQGAQPPAEFNPSQFQIPAK